MDEDSVSEVSPFSRVRILSPSLPGCVPLSKSLSFSESQFPHLQNRATDLTSKGYYREVVKGRVDSVAHTEGTWRCWTCSRCGETAPGFLPCIPVRDPTLCDLREKDS